MEAALLRTGSATLRASLSRSPKVSLCDKDSLPGMLSSDKSKKRASCLRSSLHFESKVKRVDNSRLIRRTLSDSDTVWSVNKDSGWLTKLSGLGSLSFPSNPVLDRGSSAGVLRGNLVETEELELASGGTGKGSKVGGGGDRGDRGGGGSDSDRGSSSSGRADHSKIDACYREMLKANPANPLLLRNYGQFLHQVEKDLVRAEEYYERAILANPGDGELLSLYGKLIWEMHRDQDRAESYFEQAVHASPDDCFVLGSYAHFLWDLEEEEDDESQATVDTKIPASVEAF